jgi:hypothetical protein
MMAHPCIEPDRTTEKMAKPWAGNQCVDHVNFAMVHETANFSGIIVI